MPKNQASPSPGEEEVASQASTDDLSSVSQVSSEPNKFSGLAASKPHEMVHAAVETLKAISDKNNSLLEKTLYRNLREAASLYLIEMFRNAGLNEAGEIETSPSMVSMRSRSATPAQ